jgi:hypothetical protein
VVGFTIGEVQGKRKPVIREQRDDHNDGGGDDYKATRTVQH